MFRCTVFSMPYLLMYSVYYAIYTIVTCTVFSMQYLMMYSVKYAVFSVRRNVFNVKYAISSVCV